MIEFVNFFEKEEVARVDFGVGFGYKPQDIATFGAGWVTCEVRRRLRRLYV
jgi:hypothetical protein